MQLQKFKDFFMQTKTETQIYQPISQQKLPSNIIWSSPSHIVPCRVAKLIILKNK
jgi:hypothetical protein